MVGNMYSERIKQIRQTLDLSVAKLSKKIGIAERTIVSYEYEGRTPSLDFLVQMCKKLNINPSWFLFGEGKMFKNDVTQIEQIKQIKKELLLELRQMLKDEGMTR